ncbi:MAG: rRNA maturation RNase YbeY [Lachnospiraceae bacterium]
MTITIDYEAPQALDIDYQKIIPEIAEACLDYEQCPYEAEINVVLTDNESIREINRDYRQIDAPTDVLSFPAVEYQTEADFSHLEDHAESCFNMETGELMLGDIVISVDKMKEQAENYGHSQERELAFLVAHSVLHLCGYDHMEEDERVIMEQKQRDILSGKGYER